MKLGEDSMSDLCMLIAVTLGVPVTDVSLDSGPGTLEKWDSFNHMHLMVAVEERYKIELDGDEIATMISVGDIARVLQGRGVFTA